MLMCSGLASAQDDNACLDFTDSLLEMGDIVGDNIPVPEDESGPLLQKYLAMTGARQFLSDSLRDEVPCHEEPAFNLFYATLTYQDYITLRLGQKLDKSLPDVVSLLELTLEVADSQFDAYAAFWEPPDA